MELPLQQPTTIFDTLAQEATALNAFSDEKLKQKKQEIENQYAAQTAQSDIDSKNAQSDYTKTQNALYPQKTQSEMGYQNALTREANQKASDPLLGTSGFGGEQAALSYCANKLGKDSPEFKKIQDDYNQKKLSEQQSSMSGLGTGGREEQFFQQLVSKDNPQLKSPDKIYEASNVLRMGGDRLSDGTILNPLSPASKASFDRITKGTTTAPLITKSVQANQADAEIQAISGEAQKDIHDYGDTVLGYSPQQIMDSFKSDKASQQKLGRFIAGQQVQYEIAQNEIKLANGQPGVTSTNELMNLGQQMIKAKYPKLSAEAREAAQKRFTEILQIGLKARNKVGISPSDISKGGGGSSSSSGVTKLIRNPTTGKLELA
jgi:hypothetical protein